MIEGDTQADGHVLDKERGFDLKLPVSSNPRPNCFRGERGRGRALEESVHLGSASNFVSAR